MFYRSNRIADPLRLLLKTLQNFERKLIGDDMGKYYMVVESDLPPQIFLNDTIPNVGKVVELKVEELPNRVPVAWVLERYPFSRKTIVDSLRAFNKGRDGKHLYDPKDVVPILENMTAEKSARQSRRKN